MRPLAACAFAVLLLLIACALMRTRPPSWSVGDQAVLEIYTIHASRGALQVGPYSRHGWNHPGPIYLYALAPAYLASGQREASLLLAVLFLNVAAAAAVVAAAVSGGGWRYGVPCAVWLGAYFLRPAPAGSWDYVALLTSPWNPHAALLPFAAFLAFAAALAAGRGVFLPWVVAAGSFIAQTHVAFVPVTATVAVVAAAAFRRWRSPSESDRVAAWIAGLLLVVFWLPPLLEQLTGGGTGNMTAMIRWARTGPSTDFAAGFGVFAHYLSGIVLPDFEVAAGGRVLGAEAGSAVGFALAALQIAALSVCLVTALRRGPRWISGACLVGLAASVSALFSVVRAGGEIVDHTAFWISIVGLFNFASLSAAAITWILPQRMSMSIGARAAAVAFVALPAVLAAAGAGHIRAGHHQSRFTPERVAVRSLASAALAALAADGQPRRDVLVEIEQPVWQIAAGVILELYKRDAGVAVAANWVPMFGRPMAATGRETARLVLADHARHEVLRNDSSYSFVASARGVFLYLRASATEGQDVANRALL